MEANLTHPHISVEAVRQALDGLIYSTRPRPPVPELGALEQVAQALAENGLASSPVSRRFALREVLTQQITAGYCRVRKAWGLPPLTHQPAEAVIAEDGQTHSPEVIGWSWLYWRYVQVDYEFTPERYSALAATTPRSLQRYQAHGLHRLTTALLETEGHLYRTQKRLRLRAKLPLTSPVLFLGREAEQAQLHEWVTSPPRHVHISGPPGIGKTTLVQQMVRAQIEAGQVEHLIWFSQPRQGQGVRDAMVAGLSNPSMLRVHLAQYPTVVVIDGLDHLSSPVLTLTPLLHELQDATLYIIHHTPLPFPTTAHLALAGLNQIATHKLVQAFTWQQAGAAVYVLDAEEQAAVWAATRGNPQAVQAYLYALWYGDAPSSQIRSFPQFNSVS